MINKILTAISVALKTEFDCTIYTEEIRQDLKEPCFFISCLNPSFNKFRGRRYFRRNNFVIQYFPESKKPEQECNEVAERMNLCLEHINLGDDGLIRGTGRNYQVIDGVLNYFVNYDCFVDKVVENEVMEQLEINTGIKEGD